MITVKEITTTKGLKTFVKFPFAIYKNCPQWVPPLIKDEIETLDKAKNPVFENAEAWYYMAYKDGKAAGRIAVIINRIEIEQQQKRKLRFGWFDVIDDLEVTKALLEKAFDKAKEHKLKYIEGPVGFSNMEKAGILTKGYEELNTMITWYHYPYYAQHFEALGFEKQATWVEFKIRIPKEVKEKVRKFSKIVKQRYELEVIRFTNKRQIIPYVDAMFGLLNQTYNSLQTFVPIQQYQIDYYKEKYFNFIHPDYITCIKDQTGQLIAFSVVMPSFSKALKKANGRLMPFGWWHLLQAQKKNDKAAFYLIGIHPDYQGKGLAKPLISTVLKRLKAEEVFFKKINLEWLLFAGKVVQALEKIKS